MTEREQELIGNEFTRLLKDWYRPTEGLSPSEVHVHSGDDHLVIVKVLEEFSPPTSLGNCNYFQLVPGYDPGHTMETGEKKPHTLSSMNAVLFIDVHSAFLNAVRVMFCQGPESPGQPASLIRGQTTRSLKTFTNCLPEQENPPFD
ncbi:hypothetical protein DSO57_1001663 [Entomophthora muscae]|uniref:Uncharacterized protein n=1 Tax=Entomophthora muscae TaxID=34485 RepID=A0ACC2TWN0_9FUNG|nr:hypothetical protein DSO57_1001663 [Entomophthora muscae]